MRRAACCFADARPRRRSPRRSASLTTLRPEIAAHRHEALAEGAIARPLGLEWSEKPAEEGPEESVLFDDDGLRGDDWFSDVRFVDGEEEGAVS
jgi:hypothetical protein